MRLALGMCLLPFFPIILVFTKSQHYLTLVWGLQWVVRHLSAMKEDVWLKGMKIDGEDWCAPLSDTLMAQLNSGSIRDCKTSMMQVILRLTWHTLCREVWLKVSNGQTVPGIYLCRTTTTSSLSINFAVTIVDPRNPGNSYFRGKADDSVGRIICFTMAV